MPHRLGVLVPEDAAVRLDFVMQEGITRLQELVATATGERRRYELGNAITTLNVDSIVQTQPVATLTDLLETRVPGLTVSHTSGAPGDPARLRLRGASSLTRSNDPVVIVDGIRIYGDQSSARAGNLSDLDPFFGQLNETGFQSVAAPSPLDQLDLHSIDRVEVFKGPSASTLYGADAANGVIVVTTKRGRAGPPRWTVSADYGYSFMPGEYPEGYYRWGRVPAFGNMLNRCPLIDFGCTADSLVRFQVLNDPELTVFGDGDKKSASLGVSGGSEALTYSITGSFADEIGLLKLPEYEGRQFAAQRGEPAPDWMRRPHHLSDWQGTGRVTFSLGPKADVSFTTSVSRSRQRRSSLDGQLGELMGVYADTLNGLFYPGVSSSSNVGPGGVVTPRTQLVPDFYRKRSATSTAFTDALRLDWRPLSWLTTNVDLGLNLMDRRDETLLERGMTQTGSDEDKGLFNLGTGNSLVTTVNAGANVIAPLGGRTRIRTAVGGNYTRTRIRDVLSSGGDLTPGSTSLDGARVITVNEQRSGVTTFGWYIEPTLETARFFLSTGFRLDGGDTYGSGQGLAGFPKVSASYLISDEPFFPLKKVFNTLRLRAAYGQAGSQPGPADRLRLYTRMPTWWDGESIDANILNQLGNTQLKPERSAEFEGGIDADLFNNALTLEVTAYRKLRVDAIVPVQLPPSANGGGQVLLNVGRVRNTGFEVTLGTNLLRTNLVRLSTQLHVSRNRNTVLDASPAADEFASIDGSRIREGYPLLGRWAKPIRQFADVNGNGIIERSEVQLGDEEVFLGAIEPNYEAALHTNLSFFRDILSVSAGFSYQDGATQVNTIARDQRFITRAGNDPSAPFSEQAAVAVMEETLYGLTQRLSTFRFNSLAIALNAPPAWAAGMGARSAALTVQGTNLGLSSNYRGRDPNVNAYSTGNAVVDTGQLPLPRTWSVGLRLGY
jgi:TonB-dependent SusC/RagA subfamily outer membrane receptor